MTNTHTTVEIADLIDKYRRQPLSPQENQRLQEWLKEHVDNAVWFEQITAPRAIESRASEVLDMNIAAIRKKFETKRKKNQKLR